MLASFDPLLFGLGALILIWTATRAFRFTPHLAAANSERHWRWLLVLMVVFILGYLAATFLALAQKLELLSSLTSIIFLLGSLYVAFSVFLTRKVARELLKSSQQLEERVKERTAQLARSNLQLREAKENAEETSRTKSQFLANMSHEIRTPLTAILGYTDLLTRTDPESRERRKNLKTIRRNGQHLLELINDVLDISKIEAGEMTVELLDCSPWQLVREVRSLLRPQTRAKNLGFEIETDGPIPEYIQSDPVRLRQILLNLVGNAIKFTREGSVRIVVSMEAASGDRAAATPSAQHQLRFEVIDTGIGIKPDQQETLFQPFRQASESTVRVYGGTGLGLTISHQLAHMLGGDITVRSTVGVGSTFTLIVDPGRFDTDDLLAGPLRIDSKETLMATEMSIAKERWWTRKLGGRILLAEDGVDNRRFISAVLQQVGADVTLVENGQQAVERALEARDLGTDYDAVLMDMQMPVLDGYEAAQKLRQKGYEGTIVALTAYAMSGDREKCLAAGCDDFVSKPIDVEQFLKSLAEHVRKTPHSRPADEAPEPPACGAEHGPIEEPQVKDQIISTLAGHPTLGTLVQDFVRRLPSRLEEIQTAFSDADLETLRILVHGLRGSGGTYGFKPLTEVAEQLERQLALGAEQAEVAAAVDRLIEVCERVSN